MRILRVAQKTYPAVKGGGPYHVHAMSRDQAAMGHDVTVLTIDDVPEKSHLQKQSGYTVIRYGSTANVLGNDISIGVAQYLREAESFDVIHAHSHLYFSTNITSINRVFNDTPLAVTSHGLYSQTAPRWVFKGYLHTIGRWTLNKSDIIFCYTEEEKRQMRSLGVRSDIEVISNGIDVKRFTPNGPKSDLIDHEGPVILFVGRLVEGKRPMDAIAATERVREDYPDAKLYICGEGIIRSDLETRVADKGLQEAVQFLGQVGQDKMPALYRSGDTLVLPSRAEGLPRTVLEAMACNVPVVCSDLQQISSVINESGTTVPVGDIEGFAHGIKQMLSRCENNGHQIVESEFTWEGTVRRTTKALEQISKKR